MKLVLENGSVYSLSTFTKEKEIIGEIIYNTQVVGYQEIVTDLANLDKIVVMTYPLIGNYGMVEEDNESKGITIKGLITSEYNQNPSNFRYTDTLKETLEEAGSLGVTGLDTRKLTREIRRSKITKAMISNDDRSLEECLELIKNYKVDENIIKRASSNKIRYSKTRNPLNTIAIIDLGVNKSLIKYLNSLGSNVAIVPYDIETSELKRIHPNGIIISNGPEYPSYLNLDIKGMQEIAPILAVGTATLAVAKAYNLEYKVLDSYHGGSNHPVRDLNNNTVDFYQQNHKYHVLDNKLIKVRYINLLDNTIEGFSLDNIMCTSFIPFTHEASQKGLNVYLEFMNRIKEVKNNA